jgi:hypothetical protein
MPQILSSLSYLYDPQGRGNLVTFSGTGTLDRLHCRCGSIDSKGILVNPTPIGNYALRDKSELTSEAGMWIGKPPGRKIHLWAQVNGVWTRTHLCVHADGGKRVGDGTKGCIGIQACNSFASFILWDGLVDEQGEVEVTVGTLKVEA